MTLSEGLWDPQPVGPRSAVTTSLCPSLQVLPAVLGGIFPVLAVWIQSHQWAFVCHQVFRVVVSL